MSYNSNLALRISWFKNNSPGKERLDQVNSNRTFVSAHARLSDCRAWTISSLARRSFDTQNVTNLSCYRPSATLRSFKKLTRLSLSTRPRLSFCRVRILIRARFQFSTPLLTELLSCIHAREAGFCLTINSSCLIALCRRQ